MCWINGCLSTTKFERFGASIIIDVPSRQSLRENSTLEALPVAHTYAVSTRPISRRCGRTSLRTFFITTSHPHDSKARLYDDAVEADILEAMTHPRCVGWAKSGSTTTTTTPPAPSSRLSLEADEATERILRGGTEGHKIHIHCFTGSPAFAQRLLDWFPNLYIGITGVIIYTSSTAVRNMFLSLSSPSTSAFAPSSSTPSSFSAPPAFYRPK
ncbi:hypothetical protein MSAN_00170000 [Mycena sanguinolenta]|uniref:Uncharacterized protein n=1 Tax=Mycena sanguinolenta TaxID=230812 RepID=A0A8H6ZL37_9AGAR|nr:hypothetical protein MSAN_00170000 [Mycena sanguinolenta]